MADQEQENNNQQQQQNENKPAENSLQSMQQQIEQFITDPLLVQQIDKDLEELTKEQNDVPELELFKIKYDNLHNALKESYNNECHFIKQCKDHALELTSLLAKLEGVNKMTLANEENLQISKNELARTKQSYEELKQQKQDFQDKIKKAKEEYNELSLKTDERLKKVDIENTKLLKDLRKAKDDVEKTFEVSETRLKYLQEENEYLDREVQKEEKANDNWNKEVRQYQEEITQIKEDTNKAESKRDEMQSEIDEIKAKIDQANDEFASKQDFLRKRKDSYEQLPAKNTHFQKEKDKFNERNKQLDKSIKDKISEKEEKKDRLEKYLENIKTWDMEIDSLNEELVSLKKKCIDQSKEQRAMNKRLNKLLIIKDDVVRERDEKIEREKIEQDAVDGKKKKRDKIKEEIDILLRERGSANKDLKKAEDEDFSMDGEIIYGYNKVRKIENQVLGYQYENEKLRKIITQLQKEQEKYGIEASQAHAKYYQTIEEVKIKNNQITELQKKNAEVEAKLKHQQNLYEAVRSDRNLYSKNLIDSQEEIYELQKKYTRMTHQVDQFKEEIKQKDGSLMKEDFDFNKIVEENKTRKLQKKRVKKAIKSTEEVIKSQEGHISRLKYVIQEAKQEKQRNSKDLDMVINERDILGTQLIKRNHELNILYEKIELSQSNLAKGEIFYRERQKESESLKVELTSLINELKGTQEQISCTDELKTELTSLQKDILQAKTRNKALADELENPLNVHRWRKLEATDQDLFEKILKIQTLQRRLIAKTEEVKEKDNLIKEKEKSYYQFYIYIKNLFEKHSQNSDIIIPQKSNFEFNFKKKKNMNINSNLSISDKQQQQQQKYQKSQQNSLNTSKQDICNSSNTHIINSNGTKISNSNNNNQFLQNLQKQRLEKKEKQVEQLIQENRDLEKINKQLMEELEKIMGVDYKDGNNYLQGAGISNFDTVSQQQQHEQGNNNINNNNYQTFSPVKQRQYENQIQSQNQRLISFELENQELNSQVLELSEKLKLQDKKFEIKMEKTKEKYKKHYLELKNKNKETQEKEINSLQENFTKQLEEQQKNQKKATIEKKLSQEETQWDKQGILVELCEQKDKKIQTLLNELEEYKIKSPKQIIDVIENNGNEQIESHNKELQVQVDEFQNKLLSQQKQFKEKYQKLKESQDSKSKYYDGEIQQLNKQVYDLHSQVIQLTQQLESTQQEKNKLFLQISKNNQCIDNLESIHNIEYENNNNENNSQIFSQMGHKSFTELTQQVMSLSTNNNQTEKEKQNPKNLDECISFMDNNLQKTNLLQLQNSKNLQFLTKKIKSLNKDLAYSSKTPLKKKIPISSNKNQFESPQKKIKKTLQSSQQQQQKIVSSSQTLNTTFTTEKTTKTTKEISIKERDLLRQPKHITENTKKQTISKATQKRIDAKNNEKKDKKSNKQKIEENAKFPENFSVNPTDSELFQNFNRYKPNTTYKPMEYEEQQINNINHNAKQNIRSISQHQHMKSPDISAKQIQKQFKTPKSTFLKEKTGQINTIKAGKRSQSVHTLVKNSNFFHNYQQQNSNYSNNNNIIINSKSSGKALYIPSTIENEEEDEEEQNSDQNSDNQQEQQVKKTHKSKQNSGSIKNFSQKSDYIMQQQLRQNNDNFEYSSDKDIQEMQMFNDQLYSIDILKKEQNANNNKSPNQKLKQQGNSQKKQQFQERIPLRNMKGFGIPSKPITEEMRQKQAKILKKIENNNKKIEGKGTTATLKKKTKKSKKNQNNNNKNNENSFTISSISSDWDKDNDEELNELHNHIIMHNNIGNNDIDINFKESNNNNQNNVILTQSEKQLNGDKRENEQIQQQNGQIQVLKQQSSQEEQLIQDYKF